MDNYRNIQSQKERDKTIDILYGLLSILIVYLHSSTANGFNIYDFGTNINVITHFTHHIFNAFVPMFFVMYGYLSHNSFFSSEDNWSFFKRKVKHFLPIYMFFLVIAVLRNISFWKTLSLPKIILGFLGLYYEDYITSGHIIFIINLTILTRIIFKTFKFKKSFLLWYLLILSFITNFLISRPAHFYIQNYFGFYLAVIFGMNLKHIKIFEKTFNDNIFIISLMTIISLIVPILNYNGIFLLRINYNPNSIEEIIFSGTLLVYTYLGLKNLKITIFLTKYLSKIGKKSYAHFIIHTHVRDLIIYVGQILSISPLLIQLIIIGSVSYLSVFIVYPAWGLLYHYIFKCKLLNPMIPSKNENPR